MYQQIRKLRTAADFAAYVAELGIDLPFTEDLPESLALATPTSFTDGSAGTFTSPNRFAVLPMEGWDAEPDGQPTDLVRRRWSRFADSGAGLVWGEATAVRPDGKANPNQLVAAPHTAAGLAELRASLAEGQLAGLQLTHSGRWSRPGGPHAARTGYRHPLLDQRVGADDTSILTDDELDELVDDYVAAAEIAADAGFEFVDIKHCHGYLLHEMLTAHDRPGRFGGDLDGRTNFLRRVVERIRDRRPGLAIGVRLSAYDMVPFEPGNGGVGRPTQSGPYDRAFGGDSADGTRIDLTETHELLHLFTDLGIGLVSITAGSPYYNPHIQRPTYFPPSDAYLPPEDPLIGVARMIAATAELTAAHPEVTIIGTGYSYLQEWLANVAEATISTGAAGMVGIGRMVLSYPHLPDDVLAGKPMDRPLLCRTFSDCTTAPRNGMVSGCYPIDDFYKQRPERVELMRVKREAKQAMVASGDGVDE